MVADRSLDVKGGRLECRASSPPAEAADLAGFVRFGPWLSMFR